MIALAPYAPSSLECSAIFLIPVTHHWSLLSFFQSAVSEIAQLSNGSYTIDVELHPGSANSTVVAAYMESLAAQDAVFDGYDTSYTIAWEVLGADCTVSEE